MLPELFIVFVVLLVILGVTALIKLVVSVPAMLGAAAMLPLFVFLFYWEMLMNRLAALREATGRSIAWVRVFVGIGAAVAFACWLMILNLLSARF